MRTLLTILLIVLLSATGHAQTLSAFRAYNNTTITTKTSSGSITAVNVGGNIDSTCKYLQKIYDTLPQYAKKTFVDSGWLRKADTTSLSNRINSISTIDTTALSNRINLKVSYTDTTSLIATKKNLIDTAALQTLENVVRKGSTSSREIRIGTGTTYTALQGPSAYGIYNGAQTWLLWNSSSTGRLELNSGSYKSTITPGTLSADATLTVNRTGTAALMEDTSTYIRTVAAANTMNATVAKYADSVGGAGSVPRYVTLAYIRNNYLPFADTSNQIRNAGTQIGTGTYYFTKSSIGASGIIPALVLANNTAATSLTAQNSPTLWLQGRWWNSNTNTSDSVLFGWQVQSQVTASANTNKIALVTSTAAGTYNTSGFTIGSTGQLTCNNVTATSNTSTFSSININTSITSPQFRSSASQTTVSGSSSGSAVFSEPEQGTSWKRVIIYCNALNGTASYTFPTAFTNTPTVLSTNGLATTLVTSLSTTATTVTGTTSTGFLIIEGY